MERNEPSLTQDEALLAFKGGKLIIVNTPDGIQVAMQKLPDGTVRSAIMTESVEGTPEEFHKKIAQREGGMMGIIRDALGEIGINQEIEPGSGVLQTLQHGVPASSVLDHFNLPTG